MGQFNSGYRRPNFSGSKDFYSPSNSSLAPVPASQPKSKTKLLIIVVIVAVFLIGIFALIGSVTTRGSQSTKSEEDLYDSLEVLNYQLQDFYDYYDKVVGFDLDRFYDGTYSPIGYEKLETLEDKFSEIDSSWEIIQNFKSSNGSLTSKLKALKTNLGPTIDYTKKNIDLLGQIYVAFDLSNLEVEGSDCRTNNEQFEDMKSKSAENVRQLMDEYKTEICEITRLTNDGQDLSNQIEKFLETMNELDVTRAELGDTFLELMSKTVFYEDLAMEQIETILKEMNENYN